MCALCRTVTNVYMCSPCVYIVMYRHGLHEGCVRSWVPWNPCVDIRCMLPMIIHLSGCNR